ncbi:MAG: TIGR01777 family protein [Planctomycetes bacterium]|nr:TIGR01777 family protein [Planctomycetota bacterium]
MKILLSGIRGFVGARLAERLRARGHEVVGITRAGGSGIGWDERALVAAARGAGAIVHLAGENLFDGRWNDARKQALRASRVDTTALLARVAAGAGVPALVCASAIGYYGTSDARGLNERSPQGSGFLAELCAAWEAAAAPARAAGVRTCHVRIGVVLAPQGGALKNMLPPFRVGLGAPLGSGKQWVSWVHRDDLCDLIAHLVESTSASGVFNATAPEPVDMRALSKALGKAIGRPVFLPNVPGFVLKTMLGEVADVLLTGQHVLPERALADGFRFAYPTLDAALTDLFARREQLVSSEVNR